MAHWCTPLLFISELLANSHQYDTMARNNLVIIGELLVDLASHKSGLGPRQALSYRYTKFWV